MAFDILHDQELYVVLCINCVWLLHSEYILSIILNLMDGISYPRTHSASFSHRLFHIGTYPDDRFWSWGWVPFDIEEGKEGFIKNNYETLKEFYASKGQPFPY